MDNLLYYMRHGLISVCGYSSECIFKNKCNARQCLYVKLEFLNLGFLIGFVFDYICFFFNNE